MITIHLINVVSNNSFHAIKYNIILFLCNPRRRFHFYQSTKKPRSISLQTLKKRRYLMSAFYEFSTAAFRQSESVSANKYTNT